MGLYEDVQADLGIIYTTVGFSQAAKNRVSGGIRLHVAERVAAMIARAEEELEWVDYWTPVLQDGEYAGSFYDFTPYGEAGASITYSRPGGEDWRVLLAEPDLPWGDLASDRFAAKLLLGDYLGREPTDTEIDELANQVDWIEGQEWVLSVASLRSLGFLSPMGAPAA